MLKFLKMEGIGNDYVYFDGINQDVPTDETFIKKVSNRHIGIGSDGVISECVCSTLMEVKERCVEMESAAFLNLCMIKA